MGSKVLKQLVRCKPALFASRTTEIQQPSVVSKAAREKNTNFYDLQKILGSSLLLGLTRENDLD